MVKSIFRERSPREQRKDLLSLSLKRLFHYHKGEECRGSFFIFYSVCWQEENTGHDWLSLQLLDEHLLHPQGELNTPTIWAHYYEKDWMIFCTFIMNLTCSKYTLYYEINIYTYIYMKYMAGCRIGTEGYVFVYLSFSLCKFQALLMFSKVHQGFIACDLIGQNTLTL
jgi:hypothetical protein